MEIKKVSKFEVNGRLFDEEDEAKRYKEEIENKVYLVIYTGTELTEGRVSFYKVNIIPIEVRDYSKKLHWGATQDTVEKLAWNAMISFKPKMYSGVMGSLSLMKNYDILLQKQSDFHFSAVQSICRDDPIYLDEMPTDENEAYNYIKEKVELAIKTPKRRI